MELKSICKSLTDDYHAGILTIEEVAEELFEAGRTNFVDVDYAKHTIHQFSKGGYFSC